MSLVPKLQDSFQPRGCNSTEDYVACLPTTYRVSRWVEQGKHNTHWYRVVVDNPCRSVTVMVELLC